MNIILLFLVAIVLYAGEPIRYPYYSTVADGTYTIEAHHEYTILVDSIESVIGVDVFIDDSDLDIINTYK